MNDFIRTEIRDLVARGSITVEEYNKLRCNSYEWEAMVPALDDEAFAAAMQHALKNCNPGGRPYITYDKAVCGLYGPELLKRFSAATRAARDYAATIDNVREALGQEATHYLIVADDVKDLVEAIELDAANMSEYTRRRQLGELVFPPEELHSYKELQRIQNPGFTEPLRPGLLERTPDGHINNCALANLDEEKNCQVCNGQCPDRERYR